MVSQSDFYHQIYPEWATEYVSYQEIQRGLTLSIDWDDTDEQDFQAAIAIEFQKVDTFIVKKEKDIQANISYFNRFSSDNTSIVDTLLKLKKYIRSNYQALEDLIYQHNTRGGDLMPFFIDLNKKYRLDTQRLYPLLLQLHSGSDEGRVFNAKYLIDQSYVSEVKSILLFHLPTTRTGTISQTYFDNSNFKHYISNIQWDHDAEMLLCQKSGDSNTVEIINTSINNEGRKLATMPEENVYQYLRSRHLVEPKVQIKLDQSVFSKNVLSISLENNIIFTKENGDTNTFPYAVLEISLVDPESNIEWVLDLLNSNILYPVPCYSNVLQGVASFYHKRLAILPAWWPSIESLSKLIQSKPMVIQSSKGGILTHINQIGYLEQQLSKQLKMEDSDHHKAGWEINCLASSSTTVENALNNKSSIGDVKYETQTADNRNSTTALIEPFDSRESTAYTQTKPSSSSLKRKISFIDYYDKEKKQIHLTSNPDYTILVEDSEDEEKELKKEKKEKKKEKRQKRFLKTTESTIEPKLFFANERTFIHWLQFAAQILSAALVLMNFGDFISIVSGAAFFGVSLVLSLYAFFRYRYRAYQMSNTPHDRYDDIYGPIGLCVLLLGATLVRYRKRKMIGTFFK
jgi:uncharacterized membrane protein YidH (DUF202 family)